jgi:hypothetical protein
MPTAYERAVMSEMERLGKDATFDKLTPTEAGLVAPGTSHQCAFCLRWIKDGQFHGRCAVIAGVIPAHATCDVFVEGEPKDGANIKPEDYCPRFSKKDLGYGERADGFFCKNCVNWREHDEAVGGTAPDYKPGCRLVAGEIPAEACCNWYCDFTGSTDVDRLPQIWAVPETVAATPGGGEP